MPDTPELERVIEALRLAAVKRRVEEVGGCFYEGPSEGEQGECADGLCWCAKQSEQVVRDVFTALAREGYAVVPLELGDTAAMHGAHWENHAPVRSGPSYKALKRAWPHMLSASDLLASMREDR